MHETLVNHTLSGFYFPGKKNLELWDLQLLQEIEFAIYIIPLKLDIN